MKVEGDPSTCWKAFGVGWLQCRASLRKKSNGKALVAAALDRFLYTTSTSQPSSRQHPGRYIRTYGRFLSHLTRMTSVHVAVRSHPGRFYHMKCPESCGVKGRSRSAVQELVFRLRQECAMQANIHHFLNQGNDAALGSRYCCSASMIMWNFANSSPYLQRCPAGDRWILKS